VAASVVVVLVAAVREAARVVVVDVAAVVRDWL
jgi:hypothetical protein